MNISKRKLLENDTLEVFLAKFIFFLKQALEKSSLKKLHMFYQERYFDKVTQRNLES